MKIRGILIACLLLTFLDVVSVDACGRKKYPDPNQDKGEMYVHFYYQDKEDKVEEYKEIVYEVRLDDKYNDDDFLDIDTIKLALTWLNEGNYNVGIASYTIIGIYNFNDFEQHYQEAVDIQAKKVITAPTDGAVTEKTIDGVYVTSDLVLGYYHGIRGAYHIAVLIDPIFNK